MQQKAGRAPGLSASIEPAPGFCYLSGQTPESELEAALFNKALDGFLRSLRKRPRRIFVQRYWYLLSVAEIAKDNGMSEAAVKMQLSRTRARLREHLIKEGVYYE